MKQWMKKGVMILTLTCITVMATAQCSICTKTASQLGKEAGTGLNGGIIYLMMIPFLVAGYIGYRWWKQEKATQAE